MKTGTESKIKFQKLKNTLRLRFWQTIGVLETLWRVTQINAPAGDIGKLANDEIAAAMEWEGNPDALINALIDSRWIDEDEEFRLIIHDWSEHAPNHLVGAFNKHKKLFADQIAKARGAKQPAIAPCLGTVPSTMPPSQAKPSLTNSNPASPLPPSSTPAEIRPAAGLAGGWDLWNSEEEAKARQALSKCGLKRLDLVIGQCKDRGQTPGDVFHACEEYKANKSKFTSPGAIVEFLRAGVWPVNDVLPIDVANGHSQKQLTEKQFKALESARYKLVKAGIKEACNYTHEEVIAKTKELQDA